MYPKDHGPAAMAAGLLTPIVVLSGRTRWTSRGVEAVELLGGQFEVGRGGRVADCLGS
jgi:hypothetical protein